MLKQHTFGSSRGSGSVNDIGRIVLRRCFIGIDGGLPDKRLRIVHQKPFAFERQIDVGSGDNALQPGVLNHEGQPFNGRVRIQRQIGMPRLEHTQNGRNPVRSAFKTDTNQRVLGQTGQGMGDAVGALVELGIA